MPQMSFSYEALRASTVSLGYTSLDTSLLSPVDPWSQNGAQHRQSLSACVPDQTDVQAGLPGSY